MCGLIRVAQVEGSVQDLNAMMSRQKLQAKARLVAVKKDLSELQREQSDALEAVSGHLT